MTEEEKSQPTCKTCKWAKVLIKDRFLGLFYTYKYARCIKTLNIKPVYDPVSGGTKIAKTLHYCSTARMSGFESLKTHCGPDGKYWEPKK